MLTLYVFITAAAPQPGAEGFIDVDDTKWLRDSVRDLTKAINRRSFRPFKVFSGMPTNYFVVDDPRNADIVLTVVARGTNDESFGERTTTTFYKGVAVSDTAPAYGLSRWVSMVLSVGTYRKEFVASEVSPNSTLHLGEWKRDAKR